MREVCVTAVNGIQALHVATLVTSGLEAQAGEGGMIVTGNHSPWLKTVADSLHRLGAVNKRVGAGQWAPCPSSEFRN
jgi:hypothetical protein